jgi:peptide/nickel transport system substrate-binding protein
LLINQPIPIDPDQYTLWHSTQATNLTNNAVGENSDENNDNAKIDKLLEDGRQTLDPEDRRLIYLDFQRFLVEYTPAVFLYHPTSYTILRKI